MPKIIKSKTYINETADTSKGLLKTKTLQEVRNYIQRFHAAQDPKDFRWPLKHLFVDFATDYLSASWTKSPNPTVILIDGKVAKDNGGIPSIQGETYYFKAKGISDVQQEILPSSFFSGLKQLSIIDTVGANLATKVWSKFAEDKHKAVLVRTIRTNLGTPENKDIRRVIRNCQSTSYAPYSNLLLLEDLLSHGQTYGKMPVLNWVLGDPGLRVRFACIDPTVYALSAVDEETLQTEPMPVVAAWNSETGQRKVGIGAGIYLLRNGVFIGATGRLGREEWIHRGDMTRIRGELQKKYTQMMAQAAKAVADYTEATDVTFELADAALAALLGLQGAAKKAQSKWLDKMLAGQTDKMKGKVLHELASGNLVAPSESLAGCIEAIAILAVEKPLSQNNLEYDAQVKQELLASAALEEGLLAAKTKTEPNGNTYQAITI